MPEIVCADCGKKMWHENEETLKVEDAVHKKFCRKKPGDSYSYMHRDPQHMTSFDEERSRDQKGKPILK